MITERIAAGLGLPIQFILNLSSSASHRYKTYKVRKKHGGFRTIHHPSRRLKAVQIWILRNILVSLPVHDAAAAYRQEKSVLDNAKVHAGGRFLLRLDLTDFFPSITADDFVRYVRASPIYFEGWSEQDIQCVSALLFRKGRLTIGAPTSPALSNALCFEIDLAIKAMSASKEIRYTRYADDLFFSSDAPNVLQSVSAEVESLLQQASIPKGLQLNKAKTIHSSKKRNRQVTGIVLGSDGKPHVPRAYKRVIRSMIHRFAGLSDQEKASLAGMISYVVGHEPNFTNSLIKKYGFAVFTTVTELKTLEERQRLRAARKA